MLLMLLSPSGQDHFGFKTLLWLLELLIVMPVQITGLGTSDCLWKRCASQRGRAVSEIEEFLLGLHYCHSGIAVNSCAVLNTGRCNAEFRKTLIFLLRNCW